MIEKNRSILTNALNKMSVRSPKPANWDHISDNLDQLETSNFITKHKNNLPKYKAPEGAWLGITKGIPSSFSAFLGSGLGKFISALILLGGLAGVFLIFTLPSNNEIEKQIQVSDLTESANISDQSEPNQVYNQSESMQVPDKIESKQPNLVNESDINSPQEENPINNYLSKESNANNTTSFEEDIFTMRIQSNERVNKLNPIPSKQLLASSDDTKKPLMQKSINGDFNDSDYYQEDYSSKFSVGLFYSYNLCQKIDYEGMNIPNHHSSFGFDLAYETHNWFFKIGLGYSNWNEEGNYIFDYNQMQMIYSYNYVDSAHVNPLNGQISYYTSEVEIFDSVPQQKSGQISYKYQILQIPVLIGYKFIDHSKFKIALLGGAGIDFNISGKQIAPAFNEENAEITRITNNIIYRTKINWRLIFGLNIDYNIVEKWSLYAEPSYQQYMTPLYSPNDIKGTGMFNIKVGIKYSF